MNKILLKLILHIWTRAFILKIQVDRCNDDFAFSQLLSSYRVSIFLALTINIVISLKMQNNRGIPLYGRMVCYDLKKKCAKMLNTCNARNISLILENFPFTGVLWMWDLFKDLWLCHLKGSVATRSWYFLIVKYIYVTFCNLKYNLTNE